MTILEALKKTTESIKAWAESKFLNKNDYIVDIELNDSSTNPVQNKVINTTINDLNDKIDNIDVSGQISDAIGAIDYPVDSVNGKTGAVQLIADDIGVYVQDTMPTDAVDGDIWIDTSSDPSYTAPALPEVTTADNGKVLMVVNGTYQLVDLAMSIDADGVVSI